MKYSVLKSDRLNFELERTNSFVIDDVFTYASNGLCGLITDEFQTIIPPIYEEIIPAYTSHFWGRKNKKWKLYNFKNIELNSMYFKEVTPFYNGLACVSKNGSTSGFVDRNGNFKIPDYYLKGKHLGNLFFAVGKDIQGKVKYGVINLQNEVIVPFQFNEIPTFTEVVLLLLKRRKPLREWLRM